jgi:high affinity Mn2+ porin
MRPGGAINIEQQITPDIGIFAKGSMNDGQYEEFDFTEINQSATTGLSVKGALWGRNDDSVGIAGVINGISSNAQKYFAAGGMGGLIGDGSLPSYGSEKIVEAFYKIVFVPGIHLTLDYQHVQNPAYNTVRGPIDFFAFRTHIEY